ncbi:MAG TPA: 3-deoxy-manno-octulosonate cytidylyltransferase [Gammaproteobacteria bacterium]|nr:3-deoxy-manno-octulosonate cytidylyltransferase [Gammaproteobacteria bacterium]
MSFRVAIPARYGASRLPGKPLVKIAGKPLIVHVCERALASAAAEVWVATDDERIAEACAGLDVKIALTSAAHASGTDRVAEVAAREAWAEDDIVLDLQGDEPLMPAMAIDAAAASLASDPRAAMATLAVRLFDVEAFRDPHVVKVVTDCSGNALYFSRAPLPRPREAASGVPEQTLRHVGLYAFRVATLARFALEPPCDLERAEGLEQLRALWLGMRLRVEVVADIPMAAVDTPEDVKQVEDLLAAEREARA